MCKTSKVVVGVCQGYAVAKVFKWFWQIDMEHFGCFVWHWSMALLLCGCWGVLK